MLILIVLAVLPYFENVIDRLNQSKVYSIQYDFADGKRGQYEQLLNQYKLKFRLSKEIKEENSLSVTWQVQGHEKNISNLLMR
ncbi:MAG: hypothetical protein H7Y86_06870 [Rhizobacter sp.]|nr:hypothetical protein [Ferruginibacter sp.]